VGLEPHTHSHTLGAFPQVLLPEDELATLRASKDEDKTLDKARLSASRALAD
jgi:hypothetical protein